VSDVVRGVVVKTLAELRLGSEPDAVSRARRFAVAALDEQPEPLVDDAALIVTELLTNAILHGAPPVTLRVRHHDDRVRVEVEDTGRNMPVTARHSTEAMTGRGLPLVAALSASWGVDRNNGGGGKSVWAELTPESATAVPTDDVSDVDVDALIAAWPTDDDDDDGETRYTVRLGAVPTDLLLAAKAHIDNVVREFTLARADPTSGDPDVRAHVSELVETVTRGFADARAEIKRQAVEAAARGDAQTELVLTLPLSAADAGEQYLAALDEADGYARAARLLTLASPPAHRVFRQWYVQSLVDQLRAQAHGEDLSPIKTFPQRLADEVEELAAFREAWDRLQLLQEVTSALTSARTAEEIAGVVVESARNSLGAISARVYLLNGDMLESLAAHGADVEFARKFPSLPVTADLPGGVVVRTGRPLLLRNVAQIVEQFPALADLYADAPERTLHVAPLTVGDHTLGVLSLTFPGGGQLGEQSQADFVTSLADALAQALERATALDDARAASERLSFLADASVVLSGSLDYRETLSAVAQLVVPRLADWCVIQLLDGDELTTVALAHYEPAKTQWAEQMSGRYPIDMSAPTGAPNVIRTGRSELYAEIPDELLVATAVDDEHLQLIRELGMSSVLVVPLTGRTTTFGAITLIHAESGRRYTEGDVGFAEDLARRAALAVETAEAFREQSRESNGSQSAGDGP
jgi:GAF domain-containing protein/anti-sigma regulatory factor (Ser/Thr protein kinase)